MLLQTGDLVFVDHPKYYDKALNSAATTILINKEVECPAGKALLISEDPFRDFNKLTHHFNPFIAATASIAESASIGAGTRIQPNVFIGNNVSIGQALCHSPKCNPIRQYCYWRSCNHSCKHCFGSRCFLLQK